MPQLDLPGFPTQIFWLSCLFALIYMVLHLIALPGILLILRTRQSMLYSIKAAIEKSYKQVQVQVTKYYTFTLLRIQRVNSFFVRLQKAIYSFVSYLQKKLPLISRTVRILFSLPVYLLKRTRRNKAFFRKEIKSSRLLRRNLIKRIVRAGNAEMPIEVEIREQLEDERRRKSFFYRLRAKFKQLFNMSFPFFILIHPFDDFMLVTSFLCVFIFIVSKYSITFHNVFANNYALEIKAKFLIALSSLSNAISLTKSSLPKCFNLINDIRDTYLSAIRIFAIQKKFPIKLRVLRLKSIKPKLKIKLSPKRKI